MPRNTILKENRCESPSNPSKHRVPGASTSGRKAKSGDSDENAPPLPSDFPPKIFSSGDPKKTSHSPMTAAKVKSPLPPRPPLKRKLAVDLAPTLEKPQNSVVADSGVNVVVRMRPLNRDEEEAEMIVQKVSDDSLSIAGKTFTFDSIADIKSRQIDIFELVGAPLVENCLAGFNSSVFAYGQTGSGKTYTIWGPANALEENLSNDQQGLTPRVFHRLFERINEEQTKHEDKQLLYQCRCSFLEIYNEQITDLLEPSQKNLQLREDVKTGVYVDNLTEEHVYTMKDVTQLLIKGLSNRRTGFTSINADSSRSHSVFTCVVESRCKSMSDGLNCLKTSRINLVDLAGSERQKLTGAAGERLKEAGNINRSLSQLGNLINILAEVSQTGKQRHIPYRDSKLTFLLQESLGGNAKLAMICGISPSLRCKSETLSTLRFAQRAKAIKNKATVNEEMQGDVNVLREVIRQLKDELLRMKANSNQTEIDGTNTKIWNARRSLNLLKQSLNQPMTLPNIDEDGDEEMEDVQDEPVGLQSACNDGVPVCKTSESSFGEAAASEDADVNMEEEVEQIDKSAHLPVDLPVQKLHNEEPIPYVEQDMSKQLTLENKTKTRLDTSKTDFEEDGRSIDLSVVPSDVSPVLESPTPSISPTVNNSSRKSLRTSAMTSVSHNNLEDNKLELMPSCLSFAMPSNSICLDLSSQGTRKLRSTQNLAASLQRGLEILDGHHHSASMRRSAFRMSYRAAQVKEIPSIAKVDVGVQTLFSDARSSEEDSVTILCSKCKGKNPKKDSKDANDCSNLQILPIEESQSIDLFKTQVPEAVKKVLTGAIRREMALEEMCAKQNSEIMHLNRLVQQYKHERECNALISQTREDKIYRLESLMDGILSTEEFKEEELLSLTQEHKLLREKYENHPEILRTRIELKRVQDDLQRYQDFFDLGERDILMEEIQDLRNQLQFYVDSSPKMSRKRGPILQLTYSCQPSLTSTLCTVPESNEQNSEQRFEQERAQWAEEESNWNSLVENLRSELEASQTLLQKERQELDSEKKCSEELKEAMQMAMQGHARMLEQYAELEEKHIELLARHRSFQDGVEDIKKAAARAGVRGTESKFINVLAAEISALKIDREKERRYLRDEIKGLQAQLRDTAEAVQAAGELLVRLKEAEEAIGAAEKRAIEAERETEMAIQLKNELAKKHEEEICALKQLCADCELPKEARKLDYDEPGAVIAEAGDTVEQWRQEFAPYYLGEGGESSQLEPSSWFTGYDKCNI